MKIVNFIHPGKANLPEIYFYKKYLEMNGVVCCENAVELEKNVDLYVEWRFMGTHWFNGNKFSCKNVKGKKILIHEYASLSTGRLGVVKDWLKSKFTHKPDHRLFLNHFVKNEMRFDDGIPFEYRDMAVDDVFFKVARKHRFKYDFVYVGAMDKDRELDKFLDLFRNDFSDKTILLVGKVPEWLKKCYSNNKNITFYGFVDYKSIPEIIVKAECCVNYIPDKRPYNLQTSTKLIEYCALGKKILSTKYTWVDDFCRVNKVNMKAIDFGDMYIYIDPPKEGVSSIFRWNDMLSEVNVLKKIINYSSHDLN